MRFIVNLLLLVFFSSSTFSNEKIVFNSSLKNKSKEVSVTLLIDEITDVNIIEENFKR